MNKVHVTACYIAQFLVVVVLWRLIQQNISHTHDQGLKQHAEAFSQS